MGTDNNLSDDWVEEEERKFCCQETLETFTAVGFKILVEATKRSNTLPFGKARDLYESCPSFHSVIEKQANGILSMLSEMLRHSKAGQYFSKKDDEDKFEMIVDSNDAILENVGILLDELSGIQKHSVTAFSSKKLVPISGSWNENNKRKLVGMGVTQVLNKILNQTRNIEKPQLKFKDKINNDSSMPFEPRITYKHNMLKPLACISEVDEYGLSQFSHPYEFELEKFEPTPEQLTYRNPVTYKSLEETPLILVNTHDGIEDMIKDLEKYAELAVDLEHHSFRSFQGFTCLMQISTRDTDYLIDTLSLRSDLEVLNKVFTNPGIVKVFHGADSDILWLQRDLSLYVVNMFDTHQAAKLLNFPKLSLAYLLSHYCNVNAQKQFQLADWRIRPLPQELLTYAREDTHYLLFIYDNLKNSLIEKANNQTHLLKSVLSESKKICLKRYLKPVYDVDGYLDLYRRSKKLFDNRQKFALQRLFEWRDTLARELDESYAYVLPDHMMLNISEVLPREAQGILACCNPVPVLVRQNLSALHQIVLKARDQPLVKPVLEEQRFYKYTSSLTSFDNPLRCPHDLNHEGEFRDDLPVLFSGRNGVSFGDKNSLDASFSYSKPLVSVFESSSSTSDKTKRLLVVNKAVQLTPYHRYKLSKKFSESVEVKSLSPDNKQNSYKEKTIASSPSESSNPLGELEDNPSDTGQNLAANEKKELNDTKSTSNDIKQAPVVNKRSMEQNSKPLKKLKGESTDASAHEKARLGEQLGKKKKKNKISPGSKEKEFQPFDFSSVDFQKYQSSLNPSGKKVQKKLVLRKRGRKAGKKNFGISI